MVLSSSAMCSNRKSISNFCSRETINEELACRLGVDVGGTFTDLVLLTRDGYLVTRKVR